MVFAQNRVVFAQSFVSADEYHPTTGIAESSYDGARGDRGSPPTYDFTIDLEQQVIFSGARPATTLDSSKRYRSYRYS